MEDNLIQVTQDQGSQVDRLLELAITSNLDLDKLERFMALKERHDAKMAETAFNEAFAQFQADKPQLLKDGKVIAKTRDGGTIEYQFASLPYIQRMIDPVLAKCGLTYQWTQDQANDKIMVTCHLKHVLGHVMSTSLEAPADDSGKKNKVQQIGSTIQYLRRYTLSNITGLSADQDDDGGKPSDMEVNDAQLAQLTDLIAMAEWPKTKEGTALKKRAEIIVKKKEVSAYTKAIREVKKLVPKTAEDVEGAK